MKILVFFYFRHRDVGIALARTLVHKAGSRTQRYASRRWRRARPLYGYPSTGFSRQPTRNRSPGGWLSPSERRSCLWSVANALATTPSRTNMYALTKPPDENNHPLGRLEPLKRTASRTSTSNVEPRHTTRLAVGHAFISEYTHQLCLDIREEDSRCSCGISDHSFHHILDDFPRYAQARQITGVWRCWDADPPSFYFENSLTAIQLLLHTYIAHCIRTSDLRLGIGHQPPSTRDDSLECP